jgi:hypothetical protein
MQVEELEQLCELIEAIGQSREQLGEPASGALLEN